MIADDDPVTTTLLEATLSRHGLACHVAHDGDEALLLARVVLLTSRAGEQAISRSPSRRPTSSNA